MTDTSADLDSLVGSFSILRSAAVTLRMFGATVVPLKGETVDPSFSNGPIHSSSIDGYQWDEATGIGVVAGRGEWHGFRIAPPLSNKLDGPLQLREYSWVIRNDDTRILVLRTDAQKEVLRATASILEARTEVTVTADVDLDLIDGPSVKVSVIPFPPTSNLPGGRWEFANSPPTKPPAYRALRAGLIVKPEGPNGKNRGTSKAITNLDQARQSESWYQISKSRRIRESMRKEEDTFPF